VFQYETKARHLPGFFVSKPILKAIKSVFFGAFLGKNQRFLGVFRAKMSCFRLFYGRF